MRKRLSRLSAAGLVALAIAPDGAFADLGLIFDRARALPGQGVEAFSGTEGTGRPQAFSPIRGVRVYFVPVALAKRQTDLRSTGPPRDARWIVLGTLRQDSRGFVRMRFRIPRVPAGDYTTGFWCQPCAPPKGDFFTSALPRERWRPQAYRAVIRIGVAAPAAATRPQQEPAGNGASANDTSSRVVGGILVGLLLVGSAVAAITVARRRTRKT